MNDIAFPALRVTEAAPGCFRAAIEEQRTAALPAGDVLIRVAYSSLNYKDALSATGHKGVTRQYPHTPGIDAAGTVEESTHPGFTPGDEVIVTGYDLGMNTPGGYGRYIRVPAGWVIKLPAGLTLRESMGFGTAGFTAALAVLKLQEAGLRPGQGEVLVTGATGGVGSIGCALLAKLGFTVIAGSGKPTAAEFLRPLGIRSVLTREELLDASPRPLLKGRWAGVLDTTGGDILATALRSCAYLGRAACCGLTAGTSLPLTVLPFILRGVSLIGVDSVEAPRAVKQEIWQRLAGEWRIDLSGLTRECPLEELPAGPVPDILQGKLQGRLIVRLP